MTAVEYPTADRVAGALLGTAVGDALGLPREGLSPRRASLLFGPPPLRHRFLSGRGMISDDTEHAALTAQALLRFPDDPDDFARSLARGLRYWFLGLPAGVGWATLRSVVRLWMGVPPRRSGVRSAGNGPAMRAPLLGACLARTPDRRDAFVRASTLLTHADPRAERGARLVATAAAWGAGRGPEGVRASEFLAGVRRESGEDDAELGGALDRMEEHLARGSTPAEFAAAIGLARGVTGYVYHTVPVALYCWLRFPGDFRRAVEEAVALGGDADTVGAVAGGIVGATVGASGIPSEWIDGILDWPRSVAWMRRVAARLSRQFPEDGGRPSPIGPEPLFVPGILPRNLLFLAVVLAHGFRRLLPPY